MKPWRRLQSLKKYVAVFLLISAFTTSALARQRGTASIEGTVTRLSGGDPIAGATVELSPVGPSPEGVFQFGTWISKPGPHYTATTSAAGKFLIQDVPAGTYRLYATQALGYVVAEYGQRSVNGAGQPLSLSDGQRFRDVQLVMSPAGSISGRILDRDGEPVVRAHVQAFRPSYTNGRRTLRVIQSVQTNDLGEYRLFWLPPGSYYIGARVGDPHAEQAQVLIAPPGAGGTFQTASAVKSLQTMQGGDVIEEVLVPVYYPGTIESQSASMVELRAGENLGGLEFSTTAGRVRSHHVRGVMIDERTNSSDGGPPGGGVIGGVAGGVGGRTGNGLVLLSPREASSDFPVASTNAGPNGFDIAGVLPGSYLLFALGNLGMTIQPLEVSNTDVENVRVVTGPRGLATFQGRVVVEGENSAAGKVDLTHIQIQVEREPNIAILPPPPPPPPGIVPSGSVSADGSFSLNFLPPGDYRVIVSGMPQSLYLKSAKLGTSDLLADLLHVERPSGASIQISLSARPGSLQGRILNEKQQPAANVTVALVPDPARRKRLDLYKNTPTDESGRFQIQGIAEGDYKIFAWEEVEASAWQSADFIRSYETRGKAVHIDEAGRQEIDVPLIGAQR